MRSERDGFWLVLYCTSSATQAQEPAILGRLKQDCTVERSRARKPRESSMTVRPALRGKIPRA